VTQADRERWNARYAERGAATWEPDPFLTEIASQLPRAGRVLDLAGGTGRHALWFARRGLAVTLCDVSETALSIAAERFETEGLTVDTVPVDLEAAPPPTGPWDVVLGVHYLQRDLFPLFPSLLVSGGVLVFVQPTRRNLERHAHPSERFLLEDGELPRLIEGLEVLRIDEGWTSSGRHEARVLARKR